MKVVYKEKEELYNEVANFYKEKINSNPNIVLGLATGSSPEPLYKRLVDFYNEGTLSFKDVITFNLDEYVGIDKNDKQSYYSFMRNNLFSKVDINEENINMPPNNEEGILGYEENLKNHNIDIQLLGIGTNGHIAFNEPGTSFDVRTHKIKLAQKTIDDNSRFFDKIEDVPKEAITMGLADIMEAKEIVLIAVGENKKEILQKLLADDEITTDIPATILKKHPNVVIYTNIKDIR